MAGTATADPDCQDLAIDSLMRTHEVIMGEISANAEVSHNLIRSAASRRFNRVDPIEAAAAEKILKTTP